MLIEIFGVIIETDFIYSIRLPYKYFKHYKNDEDGNGYYKYGFVIHLKNNKTIKFNDLYSNKHKIDQVFNSFFNYYKTIKLEDNIFQFN